MTEYALECPKCGGKMEKVIREPIIQVVCKECGYVLLEWGE